jgi:DNA mismatch repair protein MutL
MTVATTSQTSRSRVMVLPGAVADQIAAGEVVERPASVVKELVENALDAAATRIDIEIREGGRALIRVSDDGHGMDRDDAVAAMARHATSKIRHASDLVGVRSFGFRGEALPSIASVSRFTMETAPDDGAGTVVRVVHGAPADVGSAARRRGTTIQVEDLFAQLPARRKFLRTPRSEWRAIADVLASLALLRPEVGLWASHDERRLIAWPPVRSWRERVAAVWGNTIAHDWVAVADVLGPIHVRGFVEKPADVGTRSRRAWIAVNGRAIRDAGVTRAAEAGFRTTLTAGLRPSLILALELPGADVDVNVHPGKAEVRFRDRWEIERAVERAVRKSLGTVESAPGLRMWAPRADTHAEVDVDVLRRAARGPLFGFRSPEALSAPETAPSDRPSLHSPPAPPSSGAAPSTYHATRGQPFENEGMPFTDEILLDDVQSTSAVGLPLEDIDVPFLRQLRNTWLIAETEEGVLLIDQHSAHERVLYEQFIRDMERGASSSQRLLFPFTLHLSGAEADAFETHRGAFERLGFEVEGFGGDSVLISAVPMPHPRFDAPQCLRDTLATLAGDRTAATHARHERLAATVACKAAIKGGAVLSPPEMRALYAQLARTRLAPHDVHGRSTIVLLSWDELERRFGRQ